MKDQKIKPDRKNKIVEIIQFWENQKKSYPNDLETISEADKEIEKQKNRLNKDGGGIFVKELPQQIKILIGLIKLN